MICCNKKMKEIPHQKDNFLYYKCDECGYYNPICFGISNSDMNCIQCPEEEECCAEIIKRQKI